VSQRKIKSTEKRSQELDPSQDGFISKTTSILDWAYERRRPIGLLIAVALVGSVSGILVHGCFEEQAAKASALMAEGLEASTASVVPADEETAELPKEDDRQLTFDSKKARATETLKRWKKVVAGADADIQIAGEIGVATAHFELGEHDKAIQAYEKLLSKKGSALELLRPAAIEGLGYALEAAGKIDEAKARFDKLMAESSGEAKKMATYQAARMAQLKGDKATATKLLKEVVDTYKGDNKPSRLDTLFVQARTRLLALDPTAEVPDLPAGGMGAFEGMDPRILQQLMQARGGA
jgi:tetratricopeptide (TPR) repeat protein